MEKRYLPLTQNTPKETDVKLKVSNKNNSYPFTSKDNQIYARS